MYTGSSNLELLPFFNCASTQVSVLPGQKPDQYPLQTPSSLQPATPTAVWSHSTLFPQGYIFGSHVSDLIHLQMGACWLLGNNQEACEVHLLPCPPHHDIVVDTQGLWGSAFFTKPAWVRLNSTLHLSKTNSLLIKAVRKEEILQSLRLSAFYLL